MEYGFLGYAVNTENLTPSVPAETQDGINTPVTESLSCGYCVECVGQPIDQGRRHAGTETVVDVDDGDAGGT